MKKCFLALLVFLAIACIANADNRYSIGISPNYVDLGQVEPGSSHAISFKVSSQASESVLVLMESYTSGIDTINAKFPSMIKEFSEEDEGGWVSFIKNPIEMDPASGEKRSSKNFDFILNIPENSEPGYHAIILRPSLYVPEEKMGRVGSKVIGVTAFMVLLNVKGEASRKGIILDTVKSKQTRNQIEFSTYFQNTGTVTVYAKAEIEAGGIKGYTATEKVKPEEIKIMKSYLSSSGLGCTETCQIYVTADYYTGTENYSTTFSVSGPSKPAAVLPEEGFDLLPVLLLIAAAIVAGIFIKRFFDEN